MRAPMASGYSKERWQNVAYRNISLSALAIYTFSQILFNGGTITRITNSLHWDSINHVILCSLTCLAILATMIQNKSFRSAVTLACIASVLIISGCRTLDYRVIISLLMIYAVHVLDLKELMRVYAIASLAALIISMILSIVGFSANVDAIPNGRIVFSYGFGHPNNTGAILFSSMVSLAYCIRGNVGSICVSGLSLAVSGFCFIALSSRTPAVLCLMLSIYCIIRLALKSHKLRMRIEKVYMLILLGIPIIISAGMMATVSHYEELIPASQWMNILTNGRPYHGNHYYQDLGGFTVFGRQLVTSYNAHNGATFWGIDSAFCHLFLVYGVLATLVLWIIYVGAVCYFNQNGMPMTVFVIILFGILYMMTEQFPLYLYSNSGLLLLVAAFRGPRKQLIPNGHADALKPCNSVGDDD